MGSLFSSVDSILRTRPVFDWDCILRLEARTATLADCYIQMVKFAATINRLPSSNTLKTAIIGIYNRRYQKFDHEAYYLHPEYRGMINLIYSNLIYYKFSY
ncbi:ribonuclease H-like domain-containing protein [Rhizophagus irregularis DAOM 181602=DAOM 197198]|uniref:Uncharacterized protein n=1 Tax=Rhizophagus irregularis (strain DAOM 181602 / DAOM 197198 / MUCL 43194) TaxID=747089 RepID=A0A2P4PJ96_RHIID|nr:hypothetical protein GLOIN_2v1781690 [Rhizophagus irregularis DAOM 181602=DAOM 197198]POG65464.1 hypothetical protein GLOIN_2v1781690 [Rhizophagus irregularis DAOM 181602=DAOM 197198]GET64045.1 ribonuclease H-like domain-containing protein [Rhizophagus irregularis DAOM 181602=DAOM 197198]|eukprot:XP_025172330.1 hypothetical protein GLOIN_2v1781690 [Rhizophagus irregularis DAOM 181602=DAOM 197198]